MRRTILGRIFLLVALLAFSVSAAAAQGYRLGASDVVRIKVVEWLAADSEFRDWSQVSGEYAIGPDGTVAIPLLGEVLAEGRSTAELGADLTEALRHALALPTTPSITVEIATFRPVYVTGDVQTPGEYPFSAGLNVIKAMSLAGGERLSSATLSTDRDLITTEGTYSVLRSRQMRLLARRARLDAEIAKMPEMAIPPELAEVEGAAPLIAFEQAILVANNRKASAQQVALDDLVTLFNREIEALEQKRATVERQLEIARSDLADVQALADDGLAVNSRVSGLEQSVASFESSLLDIDTAMLRARQNISDADRDKSSLEDTRYADLTLSRQQADAEIAEIALQMSTQEALLGEIAVAGAEGEEEDGYTYLYTILRGDEEIVGNELTPIEPGDVIKVTLQRGSGSLL